ERHRRPGAALLGRQDASPGSLRRQRLRLAEPAPPAFRPGQERPRGTRSHPLAGRPHPDHRRPQDANASRDRGAIMSNGAPGRTAPAVGVPATPHAGFAAFKPFLAPILISFILAVGHFWYGILD